MLYNHQRVTEIAEEYHLRITIKDDGQIIGLYSDLKKLKEIYDIETAMPPSPPLPRPQEPMGEL